MSNDMIQPYHGPRELKFIHDSPEFWADYLKFKQYFYLAHCYSVDLRDFAAKMREFCTTDDSHKFAGLYIGLHFTITFSHLNPDLRAKYAEGVNKVKIDDTLDEIVQLVHNFGHHLDVSSMGTGATIMRIMTMARSGYLPSDSHRVIIVSPSNSTNLWQRVVESSRETAQLATLVHAGSSTPSPKDAKKARRQHIREMRIRTGQRKR